MTYTYSITYLPCQICNARVHCEECERQLEKAIMRISGVRGASVQMAKKALLVDAVIDEDTLLDALEDLGIFTE